LKDDAVRYWIGANFSWGQNMSAWLTPTRRTAYAMMTASPNVDTSTSVATTMLNLDLVFDSMLIPCYRTQRITCDVSHEHAAL
jgi:hypothetical protein